MFVKIQTLVVVALMAAVIVYFGKIRHAPKSLITGLIFCIAVSAWISNSVLSIIPLPTEKVVVTATGEKNESASADEVYITNLIVGGEEYELKNPSDGKWFWKGNVYMWRNESDTRQPAGTTRSITIDMPYGKDRSIQFGLSQWNGIVEVSYDGDVNRYDLFKAGDETVLYAPVPNTTSFLLYGIKLLRAGLFVLIIALLMTYPVCAVVRLDYNTIKSFWVRHWDKLVYIGIAFGCFWVMFEAGKEGSFWLDEVWTLGWVYEGNPNKSYIAFQALYDLWFSLMPYGQEYLLIISELLVAFSVYICGMMGSIYKSKRLGIIMSALCASSLTVMAQCGGEFRPYALLLFSVSIMVYFFIKKQKEVGNEKTITIIMYSISIVLTMDSHEFGLAAAGLMMVFDLVLIILKKSKVKCLIEFIAPGIYGLYWLCTQFVFNLQSAGNYTIANSPTIKDIIKCIIWLCGDSADYVPFCLLIFGASAVICMLIRKISKRLFEYKNDYIQLVIIAVPVLLFAFNIAYSTILNKENSLWVSRYMLPAIIYFIFLIGLGLDLIIEMLSKKMLICETKGLSSAICTLSIVIILCVLNWIKLPYEENIVNDYRGAAEYLMSENEIYCPSTLCYVTGNQSVNVGFEYYLSHNGQRESINHVNNLLDFTSADYICYDTIYVVSYRNRFNGAYQLSQNGFVEVYNNNDTRLNVRKWIRGEQTY